MAERLQGICFLIKHKGSVLMERCPKKKAVLGVGEWFIPGGKIEPGETAEEAVVREVREELGLTVISAKPLPVVEGSPVEVAHTGLFLMRPFQVEVEGKVPERTVDGGVLLQFFPMLEALFLSPVPQVRMMVAALNPDPREANA